MRQGRGIAQALAVLDIVMDRVVVQAHGLEGGEIGVAQGARGDGEDFADRKFVKAAQRHHAVVVRVHALLGRGHRGVSIQCSLVRLASRSARTWSMLRIAVLWNMSRMERLPAQACLCAAHASWTSAAPALLAWI